METKFSIAVDSWHDGLYNFIEKKATKATKISIEVISNGRLNEVCSTIWGEPHFPLTAVSHCFLLDWLPVDGVHDFRRHFRLVHRVDVDVTDAVFL